MNLIKFTQDAWEYSFNKDTDSFLYFTLTILSMTMVVVWVNTLIINFLLWEFPFNLLLLRFTTLSIAIFLLPHIVYHLHLKNKQ